MFIIVFVICFLIYQFYPVKFAVEEEEFLDGNHILIKACATTLANWELVEKQHEKPNTEGYVRLEGNTPDELNYNFISGNNVYVCYGEFLEDGNLMGEKYRRFYVESWDVIYPINRNSIFNFILPDSYICNLDL